MWRTLEADGCTWEVRVVSSEVGEQPNQEILEFRPTQPIRPTRRVAVQVGAFGNMTQEALEAAYRQARPIGGDFYGRPGKRMPDAI
jgi:hypothetical protein